MKIFTLSLALLSVASYVNTGSAQETVFELTPTYREPKNILFGANMGGSSHMAWVLTILEEMSARGHTCFFYTKDDQMKFLKNFPSIKGVSSGVPLFTKDKQLKLVPIMSAMKPVERSAFVTKRISMRFVEDFQKYLKIFEQKRIDLAVCDHFSISCTEAAVSSNIPFVVTSTLAFSPDAKAPYINNDLFNMDHPVSKGVSFFTRFNDKIISPVRYLYGTRATIQKINDERKAVGLPFSLSLMESWKDSIKLVNNVFGIEPPRPTGPLVEMIGPILPVTFSGMNSELNSFLDRRSKVVYVAFGQMAVPSTQDITMIMTAMLENIESSDLDGIIWSTRGIEDLFPDYITTSSNKTYDIRSLFGNAHSIKDKDVAFVNWAPQVAILNHPSTALFLTHGGAGSLFESLYQGVPVIVFPFFGDQPGTAYNAEMNGIGRWMKRSKSQVEATEAVRDVVRDQDGKYKDTLRRYQAMVQIRSQRGVQRGADLMEEAVFTHKDGKMTIRRDVKRDLSTIVAYNLDIYAALALLILAPAYGLYRAAAYSLYNFKTSLSKSKLKYA